MRPSEIYTSTAWKYCTKYVLLYYSNIGFVKCSTCNHWGHITDRDMITGHYHKAHQHASTVFDFTNLAPQCDHCNRYFSGKPDVMRQWLIKQHGLKAIELLDIKKNNICKLDKYTLDLIKDEYKAKFNELVKVKGNPWR